MEQGLKRDAGSLEDVAHRLWPVEVGERSCELGSMSLTAV